MAGIKVRGYGIVELDEGELKVLDATKPINVKELYRDNSLEIGE